MFPSAKTINVFRPPFIVDHISEYLSIKRLEKKIKVKKILSKCRGVVYEFKEFS